MECHKETHTNIPALRFPDFLNDEEWRFVHGNELFEPIVNKNHNSELPVLAITQDQGAVPRDMINYKVIVSEKSVAGYKVVEVGDFIISLRSFQGGIEYSNYKGLCSPAYIILRKKDDSICNDFYRYYFKSSRFIKDLNRNLEGIRDGKMISYQQFSEIILPSPPLPEQRRIAQALTALDEVIAATNEKLEQLKAYKKGLMQKLFPAKGKKLPELRFKEFEKDGEWEEKKLGEITTDIYQPQTIPQSQFSADGYPVYGANGIIGYYEFYNHDTDQILVTCRGSSCGTINYSVGKCWITGNAMVINLDRVLCHYDKRFVYYMLLGMDLSKLVTGSGQPQIVRSPLLNLEVSVTNNINEQRRIVDCLGSIDKMINQYTNKVAFLELYKKGLMQQMFPTSKR